MIGYYLKVIRSTLIIDKICQNKLNYSEFECGNLSSNETIQDTVQRHVTDYEAIKSSLGFVPKYVFLCKFIKNFSHLFRILYSVLAGTYSDKHGRRGLMFLVVLGYFLSLCSYAVNYYFLNELSWFFLYFELIYDVCGSFVLYYMMQYSYIVDVTTIEERQEFH